MMSYRTIKKQVRLTEDESARLDRIVTWMNDSDDYDVKQKRRQSIDLRYSWGSVTFSDVLRWLINSNQVDVLHARISPRTTKTPGKSSRSKRTTRRRLSRTTATR